MDQLQFDQMTITFLKGTRMFSDGGNLFGPVPKAVWSRLRSVNDNNEIAMTTDPILIQTQGKNYLIDTAINPEKFDTKAARNQGILGEESQFLQSLASLDLTVNDIDGVLMTHMHNDHANGLTTLDDQGKLVSQFPNATVYLSETEWREVRHPNARTRGTYQRANWEAVQDQVETFTEYCQLVPGIEMIRTGGHSNGHSILRLRDGNKVAYHMGDLVMTSSHFRSLYVSGYDDYPMDSIQAKELWLPQAYQEEAYFLFFHDAYHCMMQWDSTGKQLLNCLTRSHEPILPPLSQ